MLKSRTYIKPEKKDLIVKRGRPKENPESVGDVLVRMPGSGETSGYIGKNPIKPGYKPELENLDEEGKTQRRVLRALLAKVIFPNSLSSKSTPAQDKRSLVNKLGKHTLKELRELVPDRIRRMPAEKLQNIVDGTAEIAEEDEVEIQTLYMDASP